VVFQESDLPHLGEAAYDGSAVDPQDSSDLLQTGDLLARVRKGERAAGDALFNRYRPRIAAFVRARVRPGSTEVDDVVQDVCIKVWNALDRLEPHGIGSFWWYARTVARNHIVDVARRRNAGARDAARLRHQRRAGRAGAGPREAADHESAAAVDAALEKLPERRAKGSPCGSSSASNGT
jgi:RNA polymerase sigma factor (sigma-70 family)